MSSNRTTTLAEDIEQALDAMSWTVMNKLRHHFQKMRAVVHDLLTRLDVDYLLQADKEMGVWKAVFDTQTKLDEINDKLNVIRRMDEGISHYVTIIDQAAVEVDELFAKMEQAWLGYPFPEDRRPVLYEFAWETTLASLEGLEVFYMIVCEVPACYLRVPLATTAA